MNGVPAGDLGLALTDAIYGVPAGVAQLAVGTAFMLSEKQA